MKIQIDLTGTLKRLEEQAEQRYKPKPKKKLKKKVSKLNSTSDSLQLKLMALAGEEGTEESVSLEIAVKDHISNLLASGKKKEAVTFLNDNKHRFTPDMKDSLTEVNNNGL